jgi:hypothetical protein
MTHKKLLPVGTRVRFSVPHGKVRVGAIWAVDDAAYDVKVNERAEKIGESGPLYTRFEWVRLNHHEVEEVEEGCDAKS